MDDSKRAVSEFQDQMSKSVFLHEDLQARKINTNARSSVTLSEGLFFFFFPMKHEVVSISDKISNLVLLLKKACNVAF